MFFKRMELTGFKSFATKTTIEFLDGVTIIVGPNGCGKSNVFDAIRWVLGEQSARNLRGTKMGDVIFAGSATYKPMGCAQVTLVLNNESRRLPIDYSEVSVTRRLYRSGESEYLLNKIPCRLRDIHELFLDTGIGTDTYSIMEQGRVDEIVRSKPLDRRQIFEEAAGISKYKIRKAEALRKLERTEQDLTRLADRIAECRTRCNSLKRQAAKAERYKALKDAADGIQIQLMASRHREFTARIERIDSVLSQARDRVAVAQAQNDTAQARREELQLQIELADQTLQDLVTQKEDQRQYISECTNEIIRLRSRADSEDRRSLDIDKQLEEVALRATELAALLTDAKTDEARAAMRRIELEAEQNRRRAEYERLRSDSDAARSELQSLRDRIDQTNELRMRLENERSQLRLLMEQAEGAISGFEIQETEHHSALERADGDIAGKERELADCQAQLRKMQDEETQAREQAAEALRARDVLRGELRVAERKLDDAQSRLRALERLARDYEGFYGGVRSVMQAVEASRLTGILGVVAEQIQSIDSANDLAIEVALGSHVQDIVAGNADAAKEAIEFLKAGRLGRATFLPLDMLQVSPPDPRMQTLIGKPGVVGIASRLVAFDGQIERAVDHLLGRTIVTETLDAALRLERAGMRFRYVSLDGQLILPTGAMTGGSRQVSGIMTRQREMTDLAQEAAQLEAQVRDLTQRITKRETELAEAEAHRLKRREEIGELRLQMGRTETVLSALRDAREQRIAAFADLDQRVAAHRRNLDDYAARLESCNAQLSEATEKNRSCREELTCIERELYGRHAETEKLGEHVSQVDSEILRLNERVGHLRERAETYVDERAGLDRRATALRGEQTRAHEEAESLRDQARRVSLEKEQLECEVASVDGRVQSVAQEKNQAQIALHAENDRASVLMREINEATNQLNEIQADHINAQADLRHLRQTAQDRFGKPLEELIQAVGPVEADREELESQFEELRDELNRMGVNINMGALIEYKEENERYEFLTTQERDLVKARESLKETIATADKTCRELFSEAFEKIRENFTTVYRRLFAGGRADLVLVKPEDGSDPLLEGGIDIIAQPPGKKLQNISLLSGGEKALTAIALMFAIFMYKPSPFCVMDEIDAPLDDANVGRFRDLLSEFSARTQFLIVTHNKITMNLADTIYGITMQETGVSSVVSVSFDHLEEAHATA